jgi:tetratricopeptide (TPR) repeat protein
MFRVSIIFVTIAISLLSPGRRCARADDEAPLPASRPSKTDVDAAIARFNHGKQMIASGDYAHAISEIELAYKLDPRSEHLFNLAVAYQNNAQRDKAIEYYRRYLAAAPDGKLAPDAERYLYKLEAETANERSDQARADATTALAEAMAARADATGARTEANAIRARADQAEKALETERLHRTALEAEHSRPAEPAVDDGVVDDAASGRGWAMSTALTAPAGTWTLSWSELYMVSASYAVTDRFTLGAGAVLRSTSAGAGLDAKLQLARSGRLRVAAQGVVTTFRNPDAQMPGAVTLGSLGGAVTLCIDVACGSQLSTYLGLGLAHHDTTSALVLDAESLTLKITSRLKLVFEFDHGISGGFGNGSLGWYGIRFTGQSLALDLGLATPVDRDIHSWLGGTLPFVAVTYRSFHQ